MEKERTLRNITDLENEIVYTVNQDNEIVAARDLFGNKIQVEDLADYIK